MAESLRILVWKFLNTDIKDLFPIETIKNGADLGEAVLESAKVLKEQGPDIEQLTPLLGRISTLLDVLNLPWVQVVGSGLPFVSIATGLLKLYKENSQQELTLAQGMALVSQVAYLESWQALLSLPENQILLEQHKHNPTPASATVRNQIIKLGDCGLDERQAEKALVCFHDSQLAENFNRVLIARFQETGTGATEAKTLTQRIAWNTPRYIDQAIANHADQVKCLAKFRHPGARESLEKYYSLDRYLEEQIATKPRKKVFNNNKEFTFQGIYVPLKVKPVAHDGCVEQEVEALGLETWAKHMLNEPHKPFFKKPQEQSPDFLLPQKQIIRDINEPQKQVICEPLEPAPVMFIQGAPGRGKSFFCRIFADWVRQQLHPVWTPILVPLREITSVETDFKATLQAAVNAKFARDNGWLYDRNTRFLFLLDGFDELLMERRSSEELIAFLRQVSKFQQHCQQSSEMGHRVLITGRSLPLQIKQLDMPINLERVEIQLMDEELQQQWLSKWEGKFGRDKTRSFEQFLQDEHCLQQVRELAQEPLLLYLLAAMHRDQEITVDLFKGANNTTAKIFIYQRMLDWVLTKQRPEQLNCQLTGQENTENLRRILTEVGLCVVQSGGEYASVTMIETRLKDDDKVGEARTNLKDNLLRNALAAFYFQVGGKEKSVELVHKSFGEFLCAERLKESLENWTEPGRKGKGFNLPEEQLHWEIYDLLGYGGLTPEIVEYLMGLLTTTPEGAKKSEFRPVELFQRLEDFYLRWCEGEFIDDLAGEMLALKKTRQLKDQEIQLGQRQVDVYAGLNVMILLLELHRYALSRDELKDQIVFYPCGQYGTENFDETRLLYMINYSDCISIGGFLKTVGKFLNGVDLSDAKLSGVDLSGAKLSGADLSGVDFIGVNLSGADLSDAKLSGTELIRADLSRANLIGADLSRANLIGADLIHANLIGADLSRANLIHANLIHADISGVNLIGTDLIHADISGANLSGANLRNVRLNGADLSNADLCNADLTEIIWDEYTQWKNIRGWKTAVNVPDTLWASWDNNQDLG
ncbi:MAG: NACHT domain-containing protein [Symploca sp. SIO3E6]|nr:NACHT domain-containing protein [Caldora sp. SIO3E6]